MNCPICGKNAFKSRVIDTRRIEAGRINRRRLCYYCKGRFNTREVIDGEDCRENLTDAISILEKAVGELGAACLSLKNKKGN